MDGKPSIPKCCVVRSRELLESYVAYRTAPTISLGRRGSAHAKYSVPCSTIMIIKPFLLLRLAAEYRQPVTKWSKKLSTGPRNITVTRHLHQNGAADRPAWRSRGSVRQWLSLVFRFYKNSISVRALPRTPMGKLTMPPRPLVHWGEDFPSPFPTLSTPYASRLGALAPKKTDTGVAS